MKICPIAWAVHCKGCPLVKFCPAKSFLGDFDTYVSETDDIETKSDTEKKSELDDDF